MKKGIIYLFETSVKEICKIGRTDNLKERQRIIEANGYHNISGLKLIYAVESEDMVGDEAFIKELLIKIRLGNSELYEIKKETAIVLLSKVGKPVFPENENVVKEIENEAKDSVTSEILPDNIYVCNTKVDNVEYKAKLEVKSGLLILKKDSSINDSYEKLNDSYKRIREQLKVKNGVLQEDFEVASVSAAASVIAGHLKNGWDVWKDPSGEKIDKYRQ